MNAIRNLLKDIDQKVEQWEMQSAGLGGAQMSRWKNGHERFLHCRRKAQFVLDGLAVTPPWNPLLIGAAAICAELLDAYRSLKAEIPAMSAAPERQMVARRDVAAPRELRRVRVTVSKVPPSSVAQSRENWGENPLFPVGGRFQSSTVFPELVVLQGFDTESFAPC